MKFKILVIAVLLLNTCFLFAQHHNPNKNLEKVEIFQKFEFSVINNKNYNDPFRDVELTVQIKHQNGEYFQHYGFYDGNGVWKFRFSPNEHGRWDYVATFSDDTTKHKGAFMCIGSNNPGLVQKNRFNPFWLGKGNEPKTLFRSFHVGDRFFAENWDDAFDNEDGNKRTKFLDWFQENNYNMLSIASHYTKRYEKSRGEGWDIPTLWPLNVDEYKKMEAILDDLHQRDITVFPFAGFFGARGEWPTEESEQDLYIKYTLARIGHYPNIILNVAGPEPFWREYPEQYKSSMNKVELDRLGQLIKEMDVHNHILTVHNEKRATQFGDPFINFDWYDMSTLQGPTTKDRLKLFSGLLMNHHTQKPCYAQETLWFGNKWHPQYSNEDLRKNTYTILFSGSTLNFADMNGNSSTGFTGTLNFDDLHQKQHDVVHKVWDWFETIPFHQMTTRQDVMRDNSFCLANEGVEYYVYMDTVSKDEIHLDFPYPFETEWINAQNSEDIRKGKTLKERSYINAPKDGDDWIFHAWAPKPEIVATGHFPDLAVDNDGNIHLVYHRNGLRYKKYDASTKTWSNEIEVGCECEYVERSDPDVVVDSKGLPAVYCGKEFAWFDGENWHKSIPGSTRDTELAMDSEDNICLIHRGGNNGSFIGMKMFSKEKNEWTDLTDPDKNDMGSNDHVYSDFFIDKNDQIHLVQRHGPNVEVTYRTSLDGGITWEKSEDVMDERGEGPHIIANLEGTAFISTGKGYFLERKKNGVWQNNGRKLFVYSRMQPELGIDNEDNIYMTSWGGYYNTYRKGVWIGEKIIDPISNKSNIGFVETAGAKDFSYVVWEEGNHNNANEGMEKDANIVVGILYPDGRIIGLF